MWVVKLGGSLLRTGRLRHWLKIFSNTNSKRLLIVPGGGVFADRIRSIQRVSGLDESLAHQMAILGMEQFAWICHGLQPKLRMVANIARLGEIHRKGESAIVQPGHFLPQMSSLREDWSVTSDSIAVWFAKKFLVDQLILIKSCRGIGSDPSAMELMKAGIVDRMFPDLIRGYGGKFTCISADQPEVFIRAIKSKNSARIL